MYLYSVENVLNDKEYSYSTPRIHTILRSPSLFRWNLFKSVLSLQTALLTRYWFRTRKWGQNNKCQTELDREGGGPKSAKKFSMPSASCNFFPLFSCFHLPWIPRYRSFYNFKIYIILRRQAKASKKVNHCLIKKQTDPKV